jgi:hypothetical protein
MDLIGEIRFISIERNIVSFRSDVQENIIGTKIITRSLANEFEPEDITDHYKSSSKSSNQEDNLASRVKNDVNIELKIPEEIKVKFLFF